MVPCLTFPSDSLILQVRKSRLTERGQRGRLSRSTQLAPSKVIQLGSPCISPLQYDRSLPQQLWSVEIPGQIPPACLAERREREERSTAQVLSCFVIASLLSVASKQSLISLRSVSLGCWVGWDYLGVGNFHRAWCRSLESKLPLSGTWV